MVEITQEQLDEAKRHVSSYKTDWNSIEIPVFPELDLINMSRGKIAPDEDSPKLILLRFARIPGSDWVLETKYKIIPSRFGHSPRLAGRS